MSLFCAHLTCLLHFKFEHNFPCVFTNFTCHLSCDAVVIFLENIKNAFFWDYSGIGILGIDGICILLGAIPFSEWTEYHSVHSAPDSRMKGMKGIRFTRNRQNTCSFGKFLAEILRGRPRVCRNSGSQVTSAMGIPFSEEAFFSKLKFCVFCYS